MCTGYSSPVLGSRSRSARISTQFRTFKMFSRTAFRLHDASKAIRSFSVAAQVITLLKLWWVFRKERSTQVPQESLSLHIELSFMIWFVEPTESCCSRCCWRNWPAYVTANETAYGHQPFGFVRYRQHTRYWIKVLCMGILLNLNKLSRNYKLTYQIVIGS